MQEITRTPAARRDAPEARRVHPASHRFYSGFRELRQELEALSKGYPDFVRRHDGQLTLGEIPVFVFHSIAPALFERQLRYLVENGYRTIGLEEFFAIAAGRSRPAGDEVLLTIDDARSSVWRYGFSLLRRYDCRAALFVITGWTRDAADVRPHLEASGGAGQDDRLLASLDPRDQDVCTWPELKAMHDSGLVDVQSHSQFHARVFVDASVSGFFGPDSRRAAFNCDASPYVLQYGRADAVSSGELFGLPLFATRAFCTGDPHFELDLDTQQQFRRMYEQGSAGASATGWRRVAARQAPRLMRGARLARIDREQAFDRMKRDLAGARDVLVERMGAAECGRYFCVPYALGGDATVAAAREAGIRGVFWGVDPGRRANRPLDDPFRVVRIKSDFLLRLPGRNRKSLAGIYLSKLARRLRGDAPY